MTQLSLEDEVERAIRAYEAASGHPATRTWPMIHRHGHIGAIAKLMESGEGQKGFKALVASGQSELSFEAIVLRHAERFPRPVVEAARWRLDMAKAGRL